MPLERYEVFLKEKDPDSLFITSMTFWAESFSHAEEQALPYIDPEHDEIFKITRDWYPVRYAEVT